MYLKDSTGMSQVKSKKERMGHSSSSREKQLLTCRFQNKAIPAQSPWVILRKAETTRHIALGSSGPAVQHPDCCPCRHTSWGQCAIMVTTLPSVTSTAVLSSHSSSYLPQSSVLSFELPVLCANARFGISSEQSSSWPEYISLEGLLAFGKQESAGIKASSNLVCGAALALCML